MLGATVVAGLFVTLSPASSAVPPTTAINAGGPSYVDATGTSWSADNGFTGGTASSVTQTISGTQNQTMFRSQRQGMSSYVISVPAPGTYHLDLSFAEFNMRRAGRRIFDVSANGQLIIKNLDVFAEVGRFKALTKSLDFPVTGTSLRLDFASVLRQPILNGVDISPVSTSSPTASPTSTATSSPTASPTASPTSTATSSPTASPSPSPTSSPTSSPTPSPTSSSTSSPTSYGPWSWDAASASVDPNSAALVSTFVGYGVVNPNLVMNSWAVATADAKDGDPSYTVPLTSGGSVSPKLRIPLGTRPDPSGDGHLTIRDVGLGIETDLWQAKYDSTTGRISSASAGISFPLNAVNEQTSGWGGDAADTPLRRGLVTPEEIGAGAINHTLQFSSPYVGSGSPRYPALHNAATCGSSCANHLVEGTWLRLDPTLNVSALGLPAWQVTIAKALQKYGMILRDNGGTMGIYGENPVNRGGATLWSNVGLSGTSAAFSSSFPWSHLQVLTPPA